MQLVANMSGHTTSEDSVLAILNVLISPNHYLKNSHTDMKICSTQDSNFMESDFFSGNPSEVLRSYCKSNLEHELA